MRKLFSLLVLTLAAAPAFADGGLNGTVPEPESLALLAIGAVAIFATRIVKK